MMPRLFAWALLCLCAAPAQAEPLAAGDLARLRHAADAGAVHALFDLGRMYRHGIGVQRDSVRAFGLIDAAARRAYPAAMFTLSNMLVGGEGAPSDEAGARRWLEAAAESDYPEAMQQLAMNVQEGAVGFERDERRAAQLMRALAHAMKHRAHER